MVMVYNISVYNFIRSKKMKKRLFLTFVMVFIFALTLAFAVSAGTVHNENTVDYSETVTLDDGTILPLFDENKEALIWYISGKENGKNVYSSIRSDSPDVIWPEAGWDEVQTWSITGVDTKKVVVINLMDDDVVRNAGDSKYIGKPMDKFKTLFQYNTNLEYCYLRLDTRAINNSSFKACTKLKYINLEDLTNLQKMSQQDHFSGCTRLFEGQILDLSKTKLTEFENYNTFKGVPLKGVKFPSTMTKIGNKNTFLNCTNLEFISISSNTKIGAGAFEGCTSFKAIYYVGTLEQLNETTLADLLEGEAVKSYAEYKTLSDKSGQYIVYDYSRCEAFNGGVHGETTATNACVGTCNVCGEKVVKHAEEKNLSVSIAYVTYDAEGTKTTACKNTGCGYSAEEATPALFNCQGYSTPENGRMAIVIGFIVNHDAIKEYKSVTGKEIAYGVFATSQLNIGKNDIFSKDGTTPSGVVAAEILGDEYYSFELVITGFNEENKNAKIAMGAYAKVTDGEEITYSYMQDFEPNEGEKYFFISYSDVI